MPNMADTAAVFHLEMSALKTAANDGLATNSCPCMLDTAATFHSPIGPYVAVAFVAFVVQDITAEAKLVLAMGNTASAPGVYSSANAGTTVQTRSEQATVVGNLLLIDDLVLGVASWMRLRRKRAPARHANHPKGLAYAQRTHAIVRNQNRPPGKLPGKGSPVLQCSPGPFRKPEPTVGPPHGGMRADLRRGKPRRRRGRAASNSRSDFLFLFSPARADRRRPTAGGCPIPLSGLSVPPPRPARLYHTPTGTHARMHARTHMHARARTHTRVVATPEHRAQTEY